MNHHIPVSDEMIHSTSEGCECHPLLMERSDGTRFYIHNAKDCREKYERSTGEGIPGKQWQSVSDGGN